MVASPPLVIEEVNLGHAAYTTGTVIAAEKGTNGKVTGWNLTAGATQTVSSTINYMLIYAPRSDGAKFVGYVDEDTTLTSHTTTGGLMVSNDEKAVPLPNTPITVDASPVA